TLGCSLLVLVASVGIAVALSQRWPFLTSVVIVLCGVMAVGGVLSAWLLDAGKFVPACHVVNGAFVASSMLASAYLIPAEDYRRPAAEYSYQVRMLCGEDQRLYVYRMGADPVVFYLDDNVQRVESSQDLASRLRSGTAVRVVA